MLLWKKPSWNWKGMPMYKILFKTDIRAILPRQKKKSKIPGWLSYVAILAFIAVSFYMMYQEMAVYMHQFRLGDMYFTSVGSMAFAMLFFTDITLVQNQLFESKYNDVLLSMPITATDMMISRMLVILCYNYMMEMALGLPGLVAWFVTAGFSLSILVRFLLIMLIWPLLSMSMGVLFGYVLMRISAKSRHKNLTKMILFIGFMIVYYFFIFMDHSKIEEFFIDSGIMSVGGTLSFINWFGRAVYMGDIPSIIGIVALSIIPFAVMFLIVKKHFFRLISASQNVAKIEYKEKELKTHPVIITLLERELRHLGSSFIYLSNTTFAVILGYIGALGLLIAWNSIFGELLPIIGNEIAAVMALVVALFFISTYMLSASSISIEGRTIEAIKTFPLETHDILNSKLLFHYLLMAPAALLFSIAVVLRGKPGMLLSISVFLLPQLFLRFTDCLGLWLNLRHNRLDWATEAEVVKRGWAVFLVMFIGMAVISLFAGLYLGVMYKYMYFDIYLLLCCGIMAMAAIGFYLLDTTVGVKIFNRLD